MLNVEMTPNRLGFKVSGDYDDLDKLYDAVWMLTVADDESERVRTPGSPDEQIMSTRLLALCYDIRHAYQGDRELELVDSGMGKHHAEWHHLPYVEKNVAFSFNVLYPEAMYQHMALNYLVVRRARLMRKGASASSRFVDDPAFDFAICTIRLYQSKMLSALEAVASKGRFARICESANANCLAMPKVYTQWIDIINCDYELMTPKKRLENLNCVVRDIANCEQHDQYRDMVGQIDSFAQEHGCSRDEVNLPLPDLPENPKW